MFDFGLSSSEVSVSAPVREKKKKDVQFVQKANYFYSIYR